MPLEEAINALTDATLKLIELRTEAIEATKAAAAPAAKPAGKAKSADKEARDITDSPEDRKPADDHYFLRSILRTNCMCSDNK